VSRAPSAPGRLGYGDDSGREIQERQKPAWLGFGWHPCRGHELLVAQ